MPAVPSSSPAPLLRSAPRTTALVWHPLASRWRQLPGGTAGAVRDAALAALNSPGHRAALPVPDAAVVAAVDDAGRRLNIAVRDRYARGGNAGDLVTAAHAVRAAADRVGRDMESDPPKLCTGRADKLVALRIDPLMREAMGAAAELHGMSLGAWMRDAVAAAVGEHAVRRPAAQTVAARTALSGRLVGLLVQAGTLADTAAEATAITRAEDAVSAATARLTAGGLGGSRWSDHGERKRRREAREAAGPAAQ